MGDREKVFKDCLKEYGFHNQVDMAIEEMSELTKALLKYRRSLHAVTSGQDAGAVLVKGREDIIDELADVLIMTRQMVIALQAEGEVERRIDYKVERQRGRIEDERRGV